MTVASTPLQIANPIAILSKIARLAKRLRPGKAIAVECAVDQLARESHEGATSRNLMNTLLEQLDRIPDQDDGFDPLQWDELGLPRVTVAQVSARVTVVFGELDRVRESAKNRDS